MTDKPKTVIRYVGDYQKLRKKQYPPIEDFVDAYYWLQRGNPLPMQQYLEKIDVIKGRVPKIPKPEKPAKEK